MHIFLGAHSMPPSRSSAPRSSRSSAPRPDARVDALAASLDSVALASALEADPALSACTGDDGRTLLHAAAEAGALDAVDALLNAGAAMGATDADGQTALHVAASSGSLECAFRLTRAEPCAELSSEDNYQARALIHPRVPMCTCAHAASRSQMTPLHLACEEGEPTMVQLLLARGAKVPQSTRATSSVDLGSARDSAMDAQPQRASSDPHLDPRSSTFDRKARRTPTGHDERTATDRWRVRRRRYLSPRNRRQGAR